MFAFGYIAYIPDRETQHVYVYMYISIYVGMYVCVYDVCVSSKTFLLPYECSFDATLRNIILQF